MNQRIVLLLFCLCAAAAPITAHAVNKPDWPLEVLSWDIDKAYPGIEYNYRVAVKGGEYPYQFTLVEGPSGMTINKKTGEILWTPESSLTDTVVVRISDMAGNSLVHQFDITSTKTGFYFVDGAKGSDTANTGSESSPWKTMKHASATADSSGYVYVRKGTYNEAFSIASNNCGRFMAYPGESVTVISASTGNAAVWVNGGEKRLFHGFIFDANDRRWFFAVQGNSQNVIWRKNEMRNTYDTSGENPSFIFFWDQNTLYTNMVIQDNTFHDLRDPAKAHGASVTTYAVTNSLYEDNHAYDIDGRGVNEKVKGERNTFRGNIFHDIYGYHGVVLNSNPSSDSTEICYNLIYDCSGGIQIGLNGYFVSNIFVHHNTIIGKNISLSGLIERIDTDTPSTNINIYANIISSGGEMSYSTGLRRVYKSDGVTTDHFEYPLWFQTGNGKVRIDGNLLWATGPFVAGYGWGIPGTTWAQWLAHGFDVNGVLANPGLDSNYSLPADSPYRGTYGRDLSDGNHAPVLAPIGSRSVPAGQKIQFTVQGTDADGDTLQYSATGGGQ